MTLRNQILCTAALLTWGYGCAAPGSGEEGETDLGTSSQALELGRTAETSTLSRTGVPNTLDRSTHSTNAIYRDGYVYLLSERRELAPEKVRDVLGSRTFDPAEWGDQSNPQADEGMLEVGRVAQEMVNEASAKNEIDQVINPASFKGRAL